MLNLLPTYGKAKNVAIGVFAHFFADLPIATYLPLPRLDVTIGIPDSADTNFRLSGTMQIDG